MNAQTASIILVSLIFLWVFIRCMRADRKAYEEHRIVESDLDLFLKKALEFYDLKDLQGLYNVLDEYWKDHHLYQHDMNRVAMIQTYINGKTDMLKHQVSSTECKHAGV